VPNSVIVQPAALFSLSNVLIITAVNQDWTMTEVGRLNSPIIMKKVVCDVAWTKAVFLIDKPSSQTSFEVVSNNRTVCL
jgi:hypothetical protein